MKKYRAIDLFAGIGGLRLGFQQAFGDKIEFVFSSEIYEPAIDIYEANFGDKPAGDITKIAPNDVPDHDILLGGWPCQSFSIAGRKGGFRDPRGNLFFAISNILEAKRPTVFLLENVWNLTMHDKGKTFKTVRSILHDELGYTLYWDKLNSRDFGLAQNRPRIFIAGFAKPLHFEFPKPRGGGQRVKDILEKRVPEKYYISQRYFESLKVHRERHESKGHGFGYRILDPEDVAHTLVIGGMGLERNLVKDRVLPNAYRGSGDNRSKPNNEGIRTLTPGECARLMGLPESFKMPVADTHKYRVLAESVAIPLVKEIGLRMKETIDRARPAGLLAWS